MRSERLAHVFVAALLELACVAISQIKALESEAHIAESAWPVRLRLHGVSKATTRVHERTIIGLFVENIRRDAIARQSAGGAATDDHTELSLDCKHIGRRTARLKLLRPPRFGPPATHLPKMRLHSPKALKSALASIYTLLKHSVTAYKPAETNSIDTFCHLLFVKVAIPLA
jgi:hypothetical protein